MNRRSFLGSVLAAPIAAVMGWKSKSLTYASLWKMVADFREPAGLTPKERHERALSPKRFMVGFKGWENFIGGPGA